MTASGRVMRRWAVLRERRAVAAVEMALVSSIILVPLCSFTVEAGQALLTQYKLSRGLHAGLMYAWGLPTNATTATIQAAATAGFQTAAAGAYGSTTVTPVATLLYYCIDPTVGTHGATAVAANTTCSSGQVIGTWVSLTLSTSIPTIFPVYKGSAAWPLTLTGTARIQ